MQETLKAFRIQSRVIGALLLREVITRYGRHNIGFMWLFAEPMLFTLGVTALWSLAGMHHNSPLPIVAFAVTGYSSVLLWRNMPGKLVCAIEPNLSLMYHRQVKIIDIFLSRLVLEAVGATISFIVLATLWVSLGLMKLPEDVLKVLFGWFMLAWFGASLAIFLGALSGRSELVDKLWHPASYILFPLSGAAYMVDWLPKAAQEAVLYLPMVHGVEILRDGYFGAVVKTHYDVTYMAAWCLGLTVLGLAQVRVVSRMVTPE
jgi:ABC-type polysaccharide/polyol phosphate export permease